MSRNKTSVRSARTEGDQTIKPPRDLWERLEQVHSEHYAPAPDGAFTVMEYQQRFNISSYSKAINTISGLIYKGKVKFIGKFGTRHTKYYMLTGE